jgi:iron complex transport system permease protein
MQATVRNPLADPYILGTSSGASVGAVVVIVLGLNFFEPYSLSVTAFLGALASFAIVFLLAQTGGRVSPTRLILAGVATAYILSAITSFILFVGDDRAIRAVLFWMLGTLAGAKWEFLTLPAAAVAVGVTVLVLQSRSMNALLAGEETATALGVDTQRFRRQLLIISALLTGVMVAVSGAIGFVGLMMPHIIRLFVGSDHRRVLPASVLAGGIFMIWVDVVARIIVQPQELPISVITALIGAPFFLWLLRMRRHAFGGGM